MKIELDLTKLSDNDLEVLKKDILLEQSRRLESEKPKKMVSNLWIQENTKKSLEKYLNLKLSLSSEKVSLIDLKGLTNRQDFLEWFSKYEYTSIVRAIELEEGGIKFDPHTRLVDIGYFTVKEINCLLRYDDIETLGELKLFNDMYGLSGIRNLGKKSIEHIKYILSIIA